MLCFLVRHGRLGLGQDSLEEAGKSGCDANRRHEGSVVPVEAGLGCFNWIQMVTKQS